jgi:hypothetical protein
MNKRIMQTRIHKTSILLVNCYSYLQSSIYVLLINLIRHQHEKKQGQVSTTHGGHSDRGQVRNGLTVLHFLNFGRLLVDYNKSSWRVR